MLVIIGRRIPKRVRGVLQIWMLEPKANIFIGNVTKQIESKIVSFIHPYINTDTDIMIIRDSNNVQGFLIEYMSNVDNKLTVNNGLQLMQYVYEDQRYDTISSSE